MKTFLSKGILVSTLVLGAFSFSCEKEELGNDCYTCTECTGQYAHLLNDREYCVDGFDNRADWEANKTTQQEDSGCTCK